jgi:prevent-host-death family protein
MPALRLAGPELCRRTAQQLLSACWGENRGEQIEEGLGILQVEGTCMTTLSTTEAQEQFSELLRRVASGKERIVLTRAGEELVAVIPIEDLALVESLEDRADIEDAREALREAREKGTTPLADLKAELGL